MEFPVAPQLPAEILARRDALPLKPAPVTLEGKFVRLVPLDLARDADALHAVTNGTPATLGSRSVEAYDADQWVWRYMGGGPFASAADLAAWLQVQLDAPNGLPLCVFDVATAQQVGVVNLMNNVPGHLKIELGGIWYSPLVQRTPTNTEAAYLMLKHTFGLGYRRVEWKCDALNERSRRAAQRIGFRYEGIQEYHYVVKGHSRDTAWFRILDHEWDQVRAKLEARLYG